ncbi:pyrroline-5-carboxylate reductase dimerization-domain-containing protein [Aspergillus germanicus]
MPLPQKPLHLTFLGCGHIGKALLTTLLPRLSHPESPIAHITIATSARESHAQLVEQFQTPSSTSKARIPDRERDRDRGRLSFVYAQNAAAVRAADAVLFAFPPDRINDVLGEEVVREGLRGKIVISLLARTGMRELHRAIRGNDEVIEFECATSIVRAMPTIAASVHESATLFAVPDEAGSPYVLAGSRGDSDSDSDFDFEPAIALAKYLLAPLGQTFFVPERHFDTLTGLSAASNAIAAVALQSLAQRATAYGVPAELANAVAAQCIRGSASVVLRGTAPDELRMSLSAKGSITGQAIGRLEECGLDGLLEKAIQGAIERAGDYTKG